MSDYDPTDLRGQERDKAEDKAKKRIVAKNEEDDLKWLMGMKRGRSMVWRLLAAAGVYQMSFNTNSMQMAFNEGRRAYGNQLLTQVLTLCPDLHMKMQQEGFNGRNDDGNADHSN